MRKCNYCLCRSCLNTCCDRKSCGGKKESCGKYKGFQQLSIFDAVKTQSGTPRHSWNYYGITKERYKQLTEYIQSGKYDSIASQAAHTANETLSKCILLSVERNLSFEGLEKLWGRGEIKRIPYGRTDFYGIRRYAIHLFNLEMRKIGK